jgi:hypothetical protein
VEIFVDGGDIISTFCRYLHQKSYKSTLKPVGVEIVEISEVFSEYICKIADEVVGYDSVT